MNIVFAKRISAKSLDLALIGLILNAYDFFVPKYQSKFYITFILYIVYESFFTYGQRNTLGKFLFQLKVIEESKKELTFIKSILRSFLSLISMYALGLGIIYSWFNDKSLTVHEKLTNTRVIDIDDETRK